MTSFRVVLSFPSLTSRSFVRTVVPSLMFFLLLNVVAANAQDLAGLEQGIKPYGSYEGGDIDSISTVNGSLTLHIPLLSYPQRGGRLNVSFSLLYNNPTLEPWCDYTYNIHGGTYVCDTSADTSGYYLFYGQPSDYAGQSSSGAYAISAVADFPGVGQTYLGENYTVGESDGAVHLLSYIPGPQRWRSEDVTGYVFQSFGEGVQGVLTDRLGNNFEYNGNGLSQVEDANGNFITTNTNSKGITTGWTDTMGRVLPSPSNTTSTTLTGCPNSPTPATTASLWSPPGPNGTTLQYKFCFGTVNISFTAPDCGPPEHSSCQPTSTTSGELVGLVLPNSTSWAFGYDNFGDLTTIILPTGGSISYTWTTISGGCVAPPFAYSNGANTGLYPYRLAVASRTVNDETGPHTWNYNLGSSYASGGTTIVTDPLGNDTVHTISSLVGCSMYETETDKYAGSHTSGSKPLQTTLTTYNYTSALPTANIAYNVVPKTITTIDVLAGKTSQISKVYDTGVANGNGVNVIYGELLTESEYDFTGTTPLRQTNNQYMALSGPNSGSYLSYNLLSLPYTIQVTNGSGTQVSLTQYNYDENTPNSSGLSSSYQWVALPPPANSYRGNNTSVLRWLNSGTFNCPNGNSGGSNGYLTSKKTYFDDGMLNTSADPCGDTTTYTYGPLANYWGAYPTTVTNALGQATTYTYDFNSGSVTTVTDPNQQATTYTYDVMNRLLSVLYPDNTLTSYSTKYCYTDGVASACSGGNSGSAPFAVVETKAITSSVNEISTAVLDGLARLSQTQLNSDPSGVTYVDTTYDAVGRKSTVSNPHRSASSTTDGTTIYNYDPLNRVTSILEQDGSTVTTTYDQTISNNPNVTGVCSTITDEIGNQRQSCIDGLGRLEGVFEDPAHSNYETDYTYDALSNLLSVNQKGSNSSNARLRTFQCDSVSRLLSASNPESGNVSYTYDPIGNVITKTTPLPNQTNASSTATVTYTYDALNRLTGKTYKDGTLVDPYTPPAQFGYDGVALTGCTISPPSDADSYPIGRRTSMCDGSGGTSWKHDTMGRILSERRTIGSVTGEYDNDTYNLDGSATSITTLGYNVGYTYSGAGRPLTATNSSGGTTKYASGATYAPPGELTGLTMGSTSSFTGIVANNAYNNRLQPILLSDAVSGNGPVFSLCFDFHSPTAVTGPSPCATSAGSGDNGNVYRIVNNRNSNRTDSFNYDSLNRILNGQSSGTQWGEQYTLDAWGNLMAIGGYNGKPGESLNTTANPNNQLSSFGHDAAGNITSNGSTSYFYDAENRLISTNADGSYSYIYDGDGQRVEKCTPEGDNTQGQPAPGTCASGATGTMYWRGNLSSDPLSETDLAGNVQNTYIFFNGQRIARLDSASAVHYYFSDHLGTHGVVENATATTCEQDIDYYPYGGVEEDYCPNVAQHYKFTGKERDNESGLDYFIHRHYASTMGRFMQPDPLHIMKQKLIDPQQWNMYAYVRNNPLNRTDPTGMYMCADNNKCSSKQDKAFETSRQNDLKSKDPAVAAAAKAYGDKNTDNGVNVKFGDPGKGHDASTVANVSFANGKATFTQDVTIRSGLSGTALDAAVGHEGVHVEDAQAFAATVTPDFHYDLSKNLTSFQTEMNAYRVTQSIWDAAGRTASYGQCGGGQCLYGPGTNVDATTIMLLANPANGYNHFVDDNNGSYVNELGQRQLPAVDTPNP